MIEVLTIGVPFLMSVSVALVGVSIAHRIFPETYHWFAICLMAMPFYVVSITAAVGLEGWLVVLCRIGQWVIGGVMLFTALAGCWDTYAHAANDKTNDIE